MEIEYMLAESISAAGDKAAYDAACKKLLANKMILAWIMKSCQEEYRDIDVNEIAEKYIEGEPRIAKEAVNPDEGSVSGNKHAGILKLLDVLLFSETVPEEKKKILHGDFNIKMTRELERGILSSIQNLMESMG